SRRSQDHGLDRVSGVRSDEGLAPAEEFSAGVHVLVLRSTVRKPFTRSANPANDFANRPVHCPLTNGEGQKYYEWDGYSGKCAPISHHRFAVSANRGIPP